jgi:hypothetical protein
MKINLAHILPAFAVTVCLGATPLVAQTAATTTASNSSTTMTKSTTATSSTATPVVKKTKVKKTTVKAKVQHPAATKSVKKTTTYTVAPPKVEVKVKPQ